MSYDLNQTDAPKNPELTEDRNQMNNTMSRLNNCPKRTTLASGTESIFPEGMEGLIGGA